MTKQTKILVILAIILAAGSLYFAIQKDGSGRDTFGGDKDEYGCIGSAGYSWCEEKKKCIRSFEEYCTSVPPKVAIFSCGDEKSIIAAFYPGDDKYVDLSLSDGRKMSVPRAISASGARYARADESFVFWNKGDTAFVTENEKTTFGDCKIQRDSL